MMTIAGPLWNRVSKALKTIPDPNTAAFLQILYFLVLKKLSVRVYEKISAKPNYVFNDSISLEKLQPLRENPYLF